MISRREKDIVEKAFSSLGLSSDFKTNPGIVKKILKEIRLDDFDTQNETIKKFIQEISNKPKKLNRFFKIIKTAIIKKHPAIIEFLEIGNNKNWFKPSKNINKAIHVAYVLEEITIAMCNEHDFFLEVQNHYKTKEKELGLNTQKLIKSFFNALKISPRFFDIAKAFSLDPFLVYFKLQRGLLETQFKKTELKKLYKNKQINYIEYKLLSPIKKKNIQRINELVRINIYEAGITEYKKGFKTNALCAHTLCEYLKTKRPKTKFKKEIITPENKNYFYKKNTKKTLFPSIEVSENWISLYTSWNTAFVLGNLNDLDIILPKLFIPSIIDAKNDNFLGVRFISLWLTIHFTIFRKANKLEITGPKNKKEMAEALAEINKKYSLNITEKEILKDFDELKKDYTRFFSYPYCNLIKLIRNFY